MALSAGRVSSSPAAQRRRPSRTAAASVDSTDFLDMLASQGMHREGWRPGCFLKKPVSRGQLRSNHLLMEYNMILSSLTGKRAYGRVNYGEGR
jgi:hypothetical protein